MPNPPIGENDFYKEREAQILEARLGADAEAFLRSDTGRYLKDRASLEIEQLLWKLEDVDPDDAKANRDIRNDIKVRRLIFQWIDEAINAGSLARFQIDDDPEPMPDH